MQECLLICTLVKCRGVTHMLLCIIVKCNQYYVLIQQVEVLQPAESVRNLNSLYHILLYSNDVQ